MKRLKGTTARVKRILEEFPSTRNSDEVLYVEFVRECNSAAASMPFWYVMLHRKEFGIPSIETVGRCRRKVVEKHPELAGSDIVEGFREIEENKFKEYALSV